MSGTTAGFTVRGRKYGRHPAEVTADRLGDHLQEWPGKFSRAERAAIADVRIALQRVADDKPEPPAPAECGTVGAWQRHRRQGEKPCAPCKAAKAKEMRDYRTKRQQRDAALTSPAQGTSTKEGRR